MWIEKHLWFSIYSITFWQYKFEIKNKIYFTLLYENLCWVEAIMFSTKKPEPISLSMKNYYVGTNCH